MSWNIVLFMIALEHSSLIVVVHICGRITEHACTCKQNTVHEVCGNIILCERCELGQLPRAKSAFLCCCPLPDTCIIVLHSPFS